jgi:hypothetical protein
VAWTTRLLVMSLVAFLLTACGALTRSGQTPLPGPTLSPTGTGAGTGLPGGPDQGEDPEVTTTEEPDFPG